MWISLEFRRAYNEIKDAKEYEKVIREIHKSITDYKREAEKVWRAQKDEFIKNVYIALIEGIQKEKQSILDSKDKAQEFNNSLSTLMNDYINFYDKILDWSEIVYSPNKPTNKIKKCFCDGMLI